MADRLFYIKYYYINLNHAHYFSNEHIGGDTTTTSMIDREFQFCSLAEKLEHTGLCLEAFHKVYFTEISY